MDTISKVMLITHTLIAIGIIALVLLQRGKGADAGAAFGAGASGTVFGARGSSSFFSRTTAILATAFFATSLTLAYLSSQRTGAPESLLEGAPALEEPVEVAPEPGDELPLPDMPALEPAEAVSEDTNELPALEDEPATGDGTE